MNRNEWFVKVIGSICGIFAISMLALLILLVWMIPSRRDAHFTPIFITFAVLVPITYFFLFTSYRLLTGRKRKDEGLFSPTGLRMAGIMFLLFPVVAILSRDWKLLLIDWFSFGAAMACFGLAQYRKAHIEQQKQLKQINSSVPIE